MTSVPLWLFITSLAIALWLLIRGLHGKRIGDEPRCRKCNYDLTGLASDRCPECGWGVVTSLVRIGQRRRLRGSVLLGTLLLICAGSFSAQIIRSQSWWKYAPAWLVLRSADAGANGAITELGRRYHTIELSKSEISAIAQLCLKKHQLDMGVPSKANIPLITLLDDIDEGGLLTPPQRDRYYSQILGTARLEVRRKIRDGDELPLAFDIKRIYCGGKPFTRQLDWSLDDRSLELSVERDGSLTTAPTTRPTTHEFSSVLYPRGSHSLPWHSTYDHWTYYATGYFAPADYVVRYSGKIVLTRRATGPMSADAADRKWAGKVELSAPFTAVPKTAKDPVQLIVDPKLRAQVQGAVCFSTTSHNGRRFPQVSYRRRPTISLAYDVIAIIKGKEHPLCQETTTARPRSSIRVHTEVALDEVDATIILRPNRELARQTIDLFEIWGEEINLGTYKLGRIKPTSQPDGKLDSIVQ